MTAPVTTPLLRTPPFPNAAGHALVRPGRYGAPRLSDEEVDAIAAVLAEARVGGTYWASQPDLPIAPYTLVRLADPTDRDRVISNLRGERPILWWADSAVGSTPRGPPRVHLVRGMLDPWHLVAGAAEVVVDSSDELALIGALAGVAVTCIGDGRFSSLGRGGAPALRDALRQCAVDGLQYANPITGEAIGLAQAIELCGFWRKLVDSNRDITAAVGFAFWKRSTVAPLLWAGGLPVPFVSKSKSVTAGARVAIWKARTDPATLAELQAGNADLIEVEDGFIRSAGLGADCVPPQSIIVDRLGVYFDPSRPSELERLLQDGDFTPDLVSRAGRLRALIVELGVSKYGADSSRLNRRAPGRRHLLVTGQVEDDRSVVCGGGAVSTNFELLRRVRDNNPDAYIIYKPHPDVEAGHRKGFIPDQACLRLAQEIVRDQPISALIDMVDEVHVNTSLAGFEALLRGKPVTTYGAPFYAGWGLTRDIGPIPQRRTARRSLDELVAAALLLYPRYLDPVTGLPCPPEILIRRLSDGGVGQKDGPVVRLRRLQGRVNRAVAKIWAR